MARHSQDGSIASTANAVEAKHSSPPNNPPLHGLRHIVREYSVISEIHFDDEGGGQHTLSDKDVRSMRDFLKLVLSPVLKTDWNLERSTVPMNSLEGQMTLYFPDFANHMLNREVTTDVGREMLEMEKARFRMDRTLKPYRYFPTAELKRMQR